MFRIPLADTSAVANGARPEDTVIAAARALGADRSAPLLVRRDGKPVGVLTEDDIINKVLALGKDPANVTVADIMHQGTVSLDGGSLLVEDDAAATTLIHDAEPLSDSYDYERHELTEFPAGLCEECETQQDHLLDSEGALLCDDCLRMHDVILE